MTFLLIIIAATIFFYWQSKDHKAFLIAFKKKQQELMDLEYEAGFLAGWKDAKSTYIADDEEDRALFINDGFDKGVEACIKKVISMPPISNLPGEGLSIEKKLRDHFEDVEAEKE